MYELKPVPFAGGRFYTACSALVAIHLADAWSRTRHSGRTGFCGERNRARTRFAGFNEICRSHGGDANGFRLSGNKGAGNKGAKEQS